MSVSSKKKTLKEELEGKTYEEMGEWFDTHDTGEYDEQMPEVEFQVVHSARSRKYRDAKKAEEEKKNIERVTTQEKLDSLKVELEESKKLHSEVISLLTELNEELINIGETIKQIGEKFGKADNRIRQLQKTKPELQKSQEFKLSTMELTNHVNHFSKAITTSSEILEGLLRQAIFADTTAVFIKSDKEQAQESAKKSISLWQTINNGCLTIKSTLELFSKPIENYLQMQVSVLPKNLNDALKKQVLAIAQFSDLLGRLSTQAAKGIEMLNKFLADPDSVLPQ